MGSRSDNERELDRLHDLWLAPPDDEDGSFDECDICGVTSDEEDVSDTIHGKLCLGCEINREAQEEWEW